MKKMIVLTLVLVLFPINISYSIEDVKLKLPKGSTGEIYRAKAGHNYYTVVKVNGRERVMFANQYSLEIWNSPAGTFHTKDDIEQSVERGEMDFQFLLYGQAATLNRELPAAELVQTLVKESQEIFSNRNTISPVEKQASASV